MAVNQVEQTALFDFMVVRSAEEVAAADMRRRYVQDWGQYAPRLVTTAGTGPGGLVTVSPIAKVVAEEITQWAGEPGDPAALRKLRGRIVAEAAQLGMVERRGIVPGGGLGTTLLLGELEAGAALYEPDSRTHFLLPDRLSRLLPAELFTALAEASRLLRQHADTTFDAPRLREKLAEALGNPIDAFVYGPAHGGPPWMVAHRIAFDALYLLYIARRWTAVNLEPMIALLRALHALQALATDVLVAGHLRKPHPPGWAERWAQVLYRWPELRLWTGDRLPAGFPLIASRTDLAGFLAARPVVHPLFAQLFWYGRPFNDVRPIGVGDLKVVRQWLTAYLPGEISHIHNVMRGERRGRNHRRLEKTEDVFSVTDTRAEDTTHDHQSTERFEVKTEAEAVLRTSLSINATANSSLSYGNSITPMQVTASVGLGFAYSRASEDHQKTAQNFARDVVDKAVSRVESRTATTRSTTKLFETEEINDQSFENREGKVHLSGIYRWVDKQYCAQLFNYGKRLMFEFLVPEPAAFWVASRMRAYEAELDVPQPPPPPKYKKVDVKLTAAEINENCFAELQKKYDFGTRQFPPRTKTVTVFNRTSGKASFEAENSGIETRWETVPYAATIPGGKGYKIVGTQVAGFIDWYAVGTEPVKQQNMMVAIFNGSNGMPIFEDSSQSRSNLWPGAVRTAPTPIPLTQDDVNLGLGLQDAKTYHLTFDVVLEIGTALSEWQDETLRIVIDAERRQVEANNQELKLMYDAAFATYRNRIGEVDAFRVAEVLQGGAEATNRAVIDEEIKKHCLTLLTKEFDADPKDDMLGKVSATRRRTISASTTRFKIVENLEGEHPSASAGFSRTDAGFTYPMIDIDKARAKGSVVQFLEQAFEWERLSYVFYPYFWAHSSRWVELANRADLTDSTFTSFLRAGYARVLLAVTPGYDDAALHYLATREPWAGGVSPVIGDPLFIPLYEEVREQTDDRLGGVPEGDSWTFRVPTTLVYLHGSSTPLPDLKAEREARPAADPDDNS